VFRVRAKGRTLRYRPVLCKERQDALSFLWKSWQGLPRISSACLEALDDDMAPAYRFMVESLMDKDPSLRPPLEHVAQTLRGMDRCLSGSRNDCARGSGGSESSSPFPDAQCPIDYKDALAKLEERVHLSRCLKAFYRKYNPSKASDVLDPVIDMYEGTRPLFLLAFEQAPAFFGVCVQALETLPFSSCAEIETHLNAEDQEKLNAALRDRYKADLNQADLEKTPVVHATKAPRKDDSTMSLAMLLSEGYSTSTFTKCP